jgi:hypothetical protein
MRPGGRVVELYSLGLTATMKVQRILTVCALSAIVVTLLSVLLLRPQSLSTANSVSIYLRGYTNSAGADMAVMEVTNHTKARFLCFVGPRSSEARKNGRPLFCDTSAAAPPGTLAPHGVFAFAVPASADTNFWRVSVQLQELNVARPGWQRGIARILRLDGVRSFDTKTYSVTSPVFSRSDE